jgi:hypothetical protein
VRIRRRFRREVRVDRIAARRGLASASQGLYILRVMRERKQCLWEVSRIGGSSATFIGSV